METSNVNTSAKLTAVKSINGGKIQLQFDQAKSSASALSILNADDDRFKQSTRKAWMSAEPTNAKEQFPAIASIIDEVVAGGVGTSKECDIPAVMANGLALAVQIEESLEPMDDYQKANIARSVKQNPQKKTVLLSGGKPIFSKTTVVAGEPNDTKITYDKEMPLSEFVEALSPAAVSTEQVS